MILVGGGEGEKLAFWDLDMQLPESERFHSTTVQNILYISRITHGKGTGIDFPDFKTSQILQARSKQNKVAASHSIF